MLSVAQSVTGGGILQTYRRSDVTSIADFQILSVVGMHLKDTSHSFLIVFHRVVNSGASSHRTGIYLKKHSLPT